MAKRRRLISSPLLAAEIDTDTAENAPYETKAFLRPGLGAPAPIARVVADASAQAALTELSDAMTRARAEGRLVLRLALDQIDADHLVRDRITIDEEELGHLMTSLRDHGQRTPIEVVELP
ncbi:MAG: nuclease, partial [Paracoccaceae bacterium]